MRLSQPLDFKRFSQPLAFIFTLKICQTNHIPYHALRSLYRDRHRECKEQAFQSFKEIKSF